METEPKKQSAIEFAKEKLSLNPEASYADIKAQAKFEGIPIFPVVYGRAKALLGLVPTAPYGSKSKARRQANEDVEISLTRSSPPQSRLSSPAEPEVSDATTRGIGDSTGRSVTSADRTAQARAKAKKVAADGDPATILQGMIDELRGAVLERDRYRALLQRLSKMIQDELDR